MIQIEKIAEGLWTFPIVLPNNPLKWLNCYVIKGEKGGRNLLIDTGFNHPECLAALREGMAQLELEPRETDVFITHFHSDHAGNAAYLESLGCKLIISRTDYEIDKYYRREKVNHLFERMSREGMPADVVGEIQNSNPVRDYMSAEYTAQLAEDGDELSYGGYNLRCLFMPGHTPGHMCLYEPEKKLMFLGDHVLFDISPNICAWPTMQDALGVYLENLRKIRCYEVDTALPAHRHTGSVSMQERIDQLLAHHERRLTEMEEIIRASDGITAYDIAGKMRWKIRAATWETFPAAQKLFAIGETLAHLDHLVLLGRVKKLDFDGVIVYKT